ncbi:copper homeostasis membrane protein CopD [Rhizobium sp. CBN3]|uniref:copper homeostasis membrane protein CopD n=1 Tax=Rhizobium sp. CBN3 TaxID=3058045 RepID=UPI0026712FD0|nr:copper homeostasis membrane protein CopD [Rhizobium sp. CBN3]MDO3436661.1 copper homeostasis membrane protein CopD [Rhizobium sp. CBN3]
MITPETAYIACRFFLDIAALYLWGSSAYLWLLVPASLSGNIWARQYWLQALALGSIVAATIVALPFRSAILSEDWAQAFDFSAMLDVLSDTAIGTAWIWQAAGTAALLLAYIAAPMRLRAATMTVAAGFLLAGLAASGHAAMNTGWLRALHRGNDIVHVLAGGAWFGALIPVAYILPLLSDRQAGRDAATALVRFSTAGHVAVGAVLISGVANMFLIIGSFPLDWSVTYQLLLSLKILLVLSMIGLAILHRYMLVPKLSWSRGAVTALRIGTVVEIVLALAVVGLVAWFGMLEPVAM